jgi:NAD(P)-dependent dehydrogenase (short-subunit alcohol dehydrogenase family)
MNDVLGDSERSTVTGAMLLRQFGRVEELTSPMVFLASGTSSYITGTTFSVDGRLSLLLPAQPPRPGAPRLRPGTLR